MFITLQWGNCSVLTTAYREEIRMKYRDLVEKKKYVKKKKKKGPSLNLENVVTLP